MFIFKGNYKSSNLTIFHLYTKGKELLEWFYSYFRKRRMRVRKTDA